MRRHFIGGKRHEQRRDLFKRIASAVKPGLKLGHADGQDQESQARRLLGALRLDMSRGCIGKAKGCLAILWTFRRRLPTF
jgi:hypothetical protein